MSAPQKEVLQLIPSWIPGGGVSTATYRLPNVGTSATAVDMTKMRWSIGIR